MGSKDHKNIDLRSSLEKMEDVLHYRNHKKKKKQRQFRRALKISAGIFLTAVLLALVLASFAFFKFKGVYDSAILGKASLEYSLSNAKRGDFKEMAQAALRAEGYFNDILKELENNYGGAFLFSGGFTREQIADVRYLAESASIISRSMSQAGDIAEEIDAVLAGKIGENFSQFTEAEKREVLKKIYEAGPELNGIKANLELALMHLDRIKANALFLPIRGKIDNVKLELGKGVDSLSRLVMVSQLAPELFGYPDNSHFLVLFQNDSELRPTGGFLGTYGILETSNGEIVRFDTHDIYHIDMPMEKQGLFQEAPPEPIRKYLNEYWYMRDSNWSPDFPTSAKKVQWFYHQENNRLPEENKINDFSGRFSGVIAVTPALVKDLLAMIGPIEAGGDVFHADNFSELLQYKVEQDFFNQNISSWERKEVIGDILEQIKIKMFDMDYSRWPSVARILEENIEKKNILAYFNNDNLQSIVKELGVAGEVKSSKGDYLMVVDANMGAMKTDSVMEKDIEYSVRSENGRLIASLSLYYENKGAYSWKTGDYHTYTRVYVPKGSKLIKAEGISRGQATSGSELGKTYFAGFLSVRVGQKGSLSFEYELPKRLFKKFETGDYDLLVQKQPGRKTGSLKVDFGSGSRVKSYNPEESGKNLEKGRIIWNTGLRTDKRFQAEFFGH